MIIEKLSKEREGETMNLLSSVIREAFLEDCPNNLESDILEEIESKKELINKHFNEKATIFVAIKDDKVVGTCHYGEVGNILPSLIGEHLRGAIELGTIYIHKDYRNKGIGQKLIKVAIDSMRNKGIKEYYLDSGFKKAQSVWKHVLGDEEYNFKDCWGKGKDHLVWHFHIS